MAGSEAPAGPAPRPSRRRAVIVGIIVLAIVIAHVFLWRSDMPVGQKAMWTVLNAISWTVILAPILLIDRWLAAIQSRNAGRE
ncbi:MAG: hypothetical protein AAF914_03245 [Pseudomonadota bacterium]